MGIIGGGFGSRAHLPAFRADKRCEVRAIALSTKARSEKVAREFGIPKSFASWQKLIESPEIDVISIAVPASLQPAIVRHAVRYKKPFFMEKPLASKLSEARSLARKVLASKLSHAIDFELPRTDAWQKARSLVNSGKLGRIRHVLLNWQLETSANRTGERSWKTNSEQGGGALNLFASHAFHYLEWLLGPIGAVNARLLKGEGVVGEQETLCAMRVKFDAGFYGNLTIASHCIHGTGHRLEVYGDKGTLILQLDAKDEIDLFQLYYGSRRDKSLRRVRTTRIRAVGSLVTSFASAVIHHKQCKPDILDALRVQELLNAARKSHDLAGRVVFIPHVAGQ